MFRIPVAGRRHIFYPDRLGQSERRFLAGEIFRDGSADELAAADRKTAPERDQSAGRFRCRISGQSFSGALRQRTYIAILGLLAWKKVDTMRNILLLVLYNFVFVLPMLIITFAMYFFNARMGKLEAWRRNNNWLLHSIAAGVMIFIGLYLIYSWLR